MYRHENCSSETLASASGGLRDGVDVGSCGEWTIKHIWRDDTFELHFYGYVY